MATNTATTMSARARLSMSRFMGVLMDLFRRTTKITIELPMRSIITINENAMLRPMYCIDNMVSSETKITTIIKTYKLIKKEEISTAMFLERTIFKCSICLQ